MYSRVGYLMWMQCDAKELQLMLQFHSMGIVKYLPQSQLAELLPFMSSIYATGIL